MFRPYSGHAPERLGRPAPEFVPNELLLCSVRSARNDDLPHYLSVGAGVASSANAYDDVRIDGIFNRMGVAVSSISRVYVPRQHSEAVRPEAGLFGPASEPIPATYTKDEHDRGQSRTYKVVLERETDIPRLCTELIRSKAVESARPNFIRKALLRPNDEFYGRQWGLPAIDCEEAWDIETGHADVLVAVVDTGVDLSHADLRRKLEPGEDFVDYTGPSSWQYELLGDYRDRDPEPADEDGHGTHCAGIAGAESNSGTGVTGVCWGGKILPVRVMFRVFDRLGRQETSVGTDADIDAGIQFAIDRGAQVVNLSLGGSGPSHGPTLDDAYDRNVCVVCAVGNDNTSAPSYPASNPKTLAVGAVDSNLQRARFSNYGPKYNRFVMAPGVQIASTYKDNSYVFLRGTSMATPFVTGIAGLLVSRAIRAGKPVLVTDIYDVIRETATPLGSGKGDYFHGDGLVNVRAAIAEYDRRLRA